MYEVVVLFWVCSFERDNQVEGLTVLAQENKRCVVEQFLQAERKEDCIRMLIQLLNSSDNWLCGSAAHLFEVLLESEGIGGTLGGCPLLESEGIGRTLGGCSEGGGGSLMAVLVQLLTKDDTDIVTNAAGAIASLVESCEGRDWLLGQPEVFGQLLESLSRLLSHPRRSTLNAAALMLARLLLSEDACRGLSTHPVASSTCHALLRCLSHTDKDTAMNAAFAVGRLCGSRQGRALILAQDTQHQLVSSLQNLLCSGAGPEAGQTACFALSCLATEEDGHAAVLGWPWFPRLLDGLLQQLQRGQEEPEPERGDSLWFAAMAARVLVSRPEGVVKVREHRLLEKQLQVLRLTITFEESVEKEMDMSLCSSLGPEVQEEVHACLRRLLRLPAPAPVSALRLPSGAYRVSWERSAPHSGLDATYCLQVGDTVLYRGPDCHVTIAATELPSVGTLPLRLSLSTCDGDVSPLSKPLLVQVEVGTGLRGPAPPRELRVIGCTSTQVHLSWAEPEGEARVKGYHIYHEDVLLDSTTELGATVSGLRPSTHYLLRVRAVGLNETAGAFASVEAQTTPSSDPHQALPVATSPDRHLDHHAHHEHHAHHAPCALTVAVLGRHELHISWGAPLSPLGRLFNYELRMNGQVAYLGTERFHAARRLAASTAYTCTVTAITSRGRCDSRSVTKRTARDEYQNTHRCLYSPSRQTPTQRVTPSPLSPEVAEVKRKVKKSHFTRKHLPEVTHAGRHHLRVVADTDRHSIPDHNKEREVRSRLEGTRNAAEPQEPCLSKAQRGSPFPLPPKTELIHWAVQPPVNCAGGTAEDSSGTSLQWRITRKGPGKRGRLPLITSHTCKARSIQPVTFSWSTLDWSRLQSDRLLPKRLGMGHRFHSEPIATKPSSSSYHHVAWGVTSMWTQRDHIH
ncbi:uncharacterized protein LOC134458698 [Engraulis encrasicolus]|uniref:uncharacterized protein LOC134458698 n=1 Tax=Engraulis encrasicolus TaxID=184585 RepID=UPI002FD4B2AB